MKVIDLVFRSVGERTAKLALELAREAIAPRRIYELTDVKPFSECVERAKSLDHSGADAVVYVDADCLIFEDMRPFLEYNEHAYVDCYVQDRFRGPVHCGVHIMRADLVRAMANVPADFTSLAYVLRPESETRNRALKHLGEIKAFRGFRILHDHYQSYHSIFEKYALRELRSRTEKQRARLDSSTALWDSDPDLVVARHAIEHARAHVPLDAAPLEVHAYISALPEISKEQTVNLAIPVQKPLQRSELQPPPERNRRPPIFGLGLSRTGTRSLTSALHILGWHTVHYPTDPRTLTHLMRGDYRFHHLEHFDGLTDITVAPFYRDLAELFPEARFVLTVRDEEAWLDGCERHWQDRPAFDDPTKDETHLAIRRILRAATYGCYDFSRERFRHVYRAHLEAVTSFFASQPNRLLTLPLVDGAGWEPLAQFLGEPVPHEPFPHKGKRSAGGTLEEDD